MHSHFRSTNSARVNLSTGSHWPDRRLPLHFIENRPVQEHGKPNFKEVANRFSDIGVNQDIEGLKFPDDVGAQPSDSSRLIDPALSLFPEA
jgi:hypothetical protein